MNLMLQFWHLKFKAQGFLFPTTKGRELLEMIVYIALHTEKGFLVFIIFGKCTSIKDTRQLQCNMKFVILSSMVVPEVVISLSLVLELLGQVLPAWIWFPLS